MILKDLNVEALSEDDAEQTLRHVLHAARAEAKAVLPADMDTRSKLTEALHEFDGSSPKDVFDGAIAQETLLLFQKDPARQILRTDVTDGKRHARSDFSGSAFEYLEGTTLALIALSTYVRIEKKETGGWHFVFEVRPQTDALKQAFVKLVSGLIANLPRK